MSSTQDQDSSRQEIIRGRRSRTRSRSPQGGRKDSYRDERRNKDKHGRRRPHISQSPPPYRYSRSRSYSRERRKDDPARRSHLRSRSRSPKHAREGSGRHNHHRSRSRSPKHTREGSGRHDHYRSRSRSASSSGSRRYKSKKSDKHRQKSSRSRERKERKKEKKEKKEKKKKGAVTSQWGKYGIINETDLYSKEAEFRAWLVEECKVNPETLAKSETKKRFQTFVEDYNTATLPHEKFYNMHRYEARMSLLRNGELVPQGDEDTYDWTADMQAHSSAHKRAAVEHESYLSKDQLKHLRQVQHERIEIAKRKQLGLEIKQNMGVRMDGSTFDD